MEPDPPATAEDLGVPVAAHYGDPDAEYAALRGSAGLVDRSHHDVVAVTGEEALGFLQSLVSQDVGGLAPGRGAHSLLLQPSGKLDAELRLLRLDDECWLLCGPGVGARLAASLERFRIRVRAEVADRSAHMGWLSVHGPRAVPVVEQAAGVAVPPHPHAHVAWGELRVVRADWPGLPGVDVVGPAGGLRAAWDALRDAGATPAGLLAAETVRIEAGVARQGRDVDEGTIPQEAFLDLTAVSFDKGCFLGQELVCRIRDRGRVTRLLRGLRVEGDDVPGPGTEVLYEGGVAGAVTSAARSPVHGVVGLAMVRTVAEPGSQVTLPVAPGVVTRAVLDALPLVG